jgi:hypothetical protein
MPAQRGIVQELRLFEEGQAIEVWGVHAGLLAHRRGGAGPGALGGRGRNLRPC